MPISEVQFTTLFDGAFGDPFDTFGLTLDTSGSVPVARKDDKVVTLLVINERGIEWQVNATSIGVPFGINGRDAAGDAAKAEAAQKLTTALA